MRRRTLLIGSGVLGLPGLALGQAAGSGVPGWPTRPIRIIVGFAAGGATDIYARMVAERISSSFGQSAVVENRTGAAGAVANEAVARATDGHTFLMTSSSFSVGAALRAGQLPYDVLRDFAPIGLFGTATNGIYVHASVPATTIGAFVELARSRPGALTMASPGSGTTAHVTQEYFKMRTGTNLVHVPYRGSGALMADLLGGQVNSVLDNIPPYAEHVQAGRLRLLAITSAQRLPSLPDVPTVAETVAPGFDVVSWFGMLGPAATPAPVLDALNRVSNATLADAAVVARIRGGGAEPAPSTREAFGALLRDEDRRWTEVVRVSGARAE